MYLNSIQASQQPFMLICSLPDVIYVGNLWHYFAYSCTTSKFGISLLSPSLFQVVVNRRVFRKTELTWSNEIRITERQVVMLSSEGSLTSQQKFGTKLQEGISMDFNIEINGHLVDSAQIRPKIKYCLFPLSDRPTKIAAT